MDIHYAETYGDKKLIKILNSITTPKRADFFYSLSNKKSAMKLTEQRKTRLLHLAEIRLSELQSDLA